MLTAARIIPKCDWKKYKYLLFFFFCIFFLHVCDVMMVLNIQWLQMITTTRFEYRVIKSGTQGLTTAYL